MFDPNNPIEIYIVVIGTVLIVVGGGALLLTMVFGGF